MKENYNLYVFCYILFVLYLVGETAVLSYDARLTQSSVDENLETDIQLESQLTWSSLPADEETNTVRLILVMFICRE